MKKSLLKMSKRMLAAASMITKGNRVCDVGCDHGFVSIYLVQAGICPGAVAMDINSGPLKAAREHILEYGLSGYIETRLSDGIDAVHAGEAETLLCAGMGGILIRRILQDGGEKTCSFHELVLQPQSKIMELRKYLREEGYRIADENMVLEDGKYYPMMRVVLDRNPCYAEDENRQRAEDKYGPVLLRNKNKVLFDFLERERNICKKILCSIENIKEQSSAGDKRTIREREIKDRMHDIDTALSYYVHI